MNTPNLISYSLILTLGYITVFIFPLIIMSWAARKEKLPFMMFMVTMAIMIIVVVFRMKSLMDVMLTLIYIGVICLLNGIGWLISYFRNKHK